MAFYFFLHLKTPVAGFPTSVVAGTFLSHLSSYWPFQHLKVSALPLSKDKEIYVYVLF